MRVFIGYKSEDRERVRPLADALKLIGHDVFWDQEIPQGSTWRLAIGDKLSAADAAIFCWSGHTLDASMAGWVLDEADEALKQRKPIFSVMLDKVSPPMGHRQRQASDFSNWSGAPGDPAFLALAQALSSPQTGAPLISPALAQRVHAKKPGGAGALPWIAAIVLGMGMMAVAGTLWLGKEGSPRAEVAGPAATPAKPQFEPFDPAQLNPLIEAAVHKARAMRLRAEDIVQRVNKTTSNALEAFSAAAAGTDGYGTFEAKSTYGDRTSKMQGTQLSNSKYLGVIVDEDEDASAWGDIELRGTLDSGYFAVNLGVDERGRLGWFGGNFIGKWSHRDGGTVFQEEGAFGTGDYQYTMMSTVSIDYPDGSRYEGGYASSNIVSGYGYHGYGVLWTKDGKALSSGRWELGNLVEPLERDKPAD